jgi:hypothetical protein
VSVIAGGPGMGSYAGSIVSATQGNSATRGTAL